jgi:hypothetical protein
MVDNISVEIVAKQRSELTDRIAKQVIRNFGSYNAAKYMRIAGCENPYWDGLRCLVLWNPISIKEVFKVFKNKQIPAELLEVDFEEYPRVTGQVNYGFIHINTDFPAEDEPSISREFPFTVACINSIPIMSNKKKNAKINAKVACGPALELIVLDKLQLTKEQQEMFRIVPYWEGPEYVDFNHFKYDEFRKLGLDGLTNAFLLAYERRMD